jgi:hypothetical protein
MYPFSYPHMQHKFRIRSFISLTSKWTPPCNDSHWSYVFRWSRVWNQVQRSVLWGLSLNFIGPCIVIYSYSTINKKHLLPQIVYSCKTLYMFWTVFSSIIRSTKLHIQKRCMLNSCCYLLLSGMRWNCSSISSPIAAGNSSCLTYTVAVYAVFSSCLWTKRPSETCRAFYKNK